MIELIKALALGILISGAAIIATFTFILLSYQVAVLAVLGLVGVFAGPVFGGFGVGWVMPRPGSKPPLASVVAVTVGTFLGWSLFSLVVEGRGWCDVGKPLRETCSLVGLMGFVALVFGWGLGPIGALFGRAMRRRRSPKP